MTHRKHKKEITVMFISHYAGLNGAPRSMINLISKLKETNVKCVVIIPEHGVIEAELRKNKIKYYIVKFEDCYHRISQENSFFIYVKREFHNFIAAYKLAKIMKEEKVDIVHSNSYAVDVGAMAALITGKPHVWHFREFMKEDWGFKHNFEVIDRWLAKKSTKVLAVSDAVREKYVKEQGLRNVSTVYNGVPIQNYVIDREKVLEDNTIKILISGYVCDKKGQKEAVDACGLLVKKGCRNIKLYIAGDGDKKYTAFLKGYIRQKSLGKYVTFLGFQGDMRSVRKQMDAELVCSVCEAFGRVTVEAMLAELLVIGTDSGGTKELIKPGWNGLLYQSGNATDLANKIEQVMQNREKYVSCVKNGKQYVINNFDISITARKVLEIYQKILQRTR